MGGVCVYYSDDTALPSIFLVFDPLKRGVSCGISVVGPVNSVEKWKTKGVRVNKRSFTSKERESLQALDEKLTDAYKILESIDPDCIRAYEKGVPSDLLNCISHGLTLARAASGKALVEDTLREFTGPVN